MVILKLLKWKVDAALMKNAIVNMYSYCQLIEILFLYCCNCYEAVTFTK